VRILALFLTLAVSFLAAQNTGRLAGKIEDPASAAVPNAAVSLSLPGAAEPAYTTTSSGEGYFNFIGVRPGTYDLSIRSQGFQNQLLRALKIDPGRELSLPAIRLEIGAVAETVDVVAQSAGVQTVNVEVSNSVTSAQIQDLPVLDRQMITLIKTQAGVSDGRGTTTVNGLRTSAVNVTVDGINVQDNYFRRNGLDFMPNRPTTDQIAEFTLTTSNQNATVGGGAAQVIMVTPSGSNEYHGRLLWNNRNNYFAAGDWFANQQGLGKPFLNQNQLGGYLGGAVIKNKLLFYGGYERLDARQQVAVNRRILTTDARRGIFTYRDTSGQPRKVNILEAMNVTADPAMMRLLEEVPGPEKVNNFDTGDSLPDFLRNTAGYSFNIRDNLKRDNLTGKLDYLLSPQHTFAGTFLWNKEFKDRWDAQDDSTVEFNSYDPVPHTFTDAARKLFSASWRWNPTPRFTNELRGGFNLAPTAFKTVEGELPEVQFFNTWFSNPRHNYGPNGRDTYSFHYMNNSNYVTGKHNLQFGFNLQQLKIRSSSYLGIPALYRINIGTGNPGLTNTHLPGAAATDIANANRLLASLAGYIDRYSQTFNVTDRNSGFVPDAPEIRRYRWQSLALYLQDNWKVQRRLSLTLGLRWEPFWPFDEKDGLALLPRLVNDNYVETLSGNGTFDFAGSAVGRPWYKTDWNNFAPNVGLAWDVFGDGRTSFRAGYMVSFFNDNVVAAVRNNVAGTNAGLTQMAVRSGLSASIRNGLPGIPTPPFRIPTTFADNIAIDPTAAAGLPDPDLVSPYMQQWSAGIQRDIKGMILEIRYVGNKGTKLYRGIDFNQVNIQNHGLLEDFKRARNNGFLAFAATGQFNPIYNPDIPGSQPLTLLSRFPDNATYRTLIQRGDVGEYANTVHVDRQNGNLSFFPNPLIQGGNILLNYGNSSYHSLQIDVTRRFSNGLQFQGNYVYGKVLSDIGIETNEQFDPLLDNNAPQVERARAPWDLTHVIKGNVLWQIPTGKLQNRLLRHVLGGWSIGSFLTWQSGPPFSILSARATVNRAGVRSAQNTATSVHDKEQLDEILQFRMTPSGPFFAAASLKNPADGRATSPDGQAPFTGQAFLHPGPGELGQLQRRMFSGPWCFNVDASVIKRFAIAEQQSIEFRAEAFNTTNTPTWFVDNMNIDSTQFGKITSNFYDRRLMQFGLVYRF
jgi:hypothetical protein